jgi:hypothetical protein
MPILKHSDESLGLRNCIYKNKYHCNNMKMKRKYIRLSLIPETILKATKKACLERETVKKKTGTRAHYYIGTF